MCNTFQSPVNSGSYSANYEEISTYVLCFSILFLLLFPPISAAVDVLSSWNYIFHYVFRDIYLKCCWMDLQETSDATSLTLGVAAAAGLGLLAFTEVMNLVRFYFY